MSTSNGQTMLKFQELLKPGTGDAADVEEAVVRLIQESAGLPASDLFLTPEERGVTVSIRHLGVLKRVALLPKKVGQHFINSIKVHAEMDLAQRFHPLDGRWKCSFDDDGDGIDLRVSTIPSLYGESLAVRLPVCEPDELELSRLGMRQADYDDLVQLLARPSGLILITGPTEAGKTTTSYACLNYLNDGTQRINTIEDPIEYSLPGVCQSEVNLKMKLDFPDLLRGVLRQAPNVIKVGEIRDPVTAETAVRAANSGCLVFATLHSPTAAAAVDSMLGLGVHPHFLATSMLAVVAQRLVRTLCPHCRAPVETAGISSLLESVRPWLEPDGDYAIYKAVGCDECRQGGYDGRTGIFEILRVSKAFRRKIFEQRSIGELHDQALDDGMLDLRRAGLLKVATGVTTMEEVVHATPGEFTGRPE